MPNHAELPVISVIVPVHNGQGYLENCISCIRGQTCDNLEIILVNDGSSDRTEQLCRNLEQNYGNVEVISLDGKGVSAARNAGLDRAKGEYVTFVDVDDRIRPDMIKILYESLISTKSDVAGCNFFEWSKEEEWEERKEGRAGERREILVFTPEQFMLRGILENDTRCWSKLYRRDIIQKVRFREGLTIGEDMMFLADLLPFVNRFAVVDYQGYGYYCNPYGAMQRTFKSSYMDQITCWEMADKQLKLFAEQKKMPESEKKYVREKCIARLLMGIMLTVGKIAELPSWERKNCCHYLQECHGKVKKVYDGQRFADNLDISYRIKVTFFRLLPKAYVRLYGALKRLKP